MKNSFDQLIAAIARDLSGKKAVLGISGGKDSSIAAALLTIALGKENVFGVSMPNGDGSADEPFVEMLEENLGISVKRTNIKKIYEAHLAQMGDMEVLDDTKINLPARIRMAMLFMFAQSIPNARVINTCNLSEDMMGYSTLFGDFAGSYAPLKYFTVTELREQIGQILIDQYKFPEKLINRPPSDGLCGLDDEQKMGLQYAEIDWYIRNGTVNPMIWVLVPRENQTAYAVDRINKIRTRYEANKFKLDIVNIPGPSIDHMQGKNYLLYPNNGETN